MERHEVENLRLGIEAAGESGATKITIGKAIVTHEFLIALCDEWIEAQDHECEIEEWICDHPVCDCDCDACAKCESANDHKP